MFNKDNEEIKSPLTTPVDSTPPLQQNLNLEVSVNIGEDLGEIMASPVAPLLAPYEAQPHYGSVYRDEENNVIISSNPQTFFTTKNKVLISAALMTAGLLGGAVLGWAAGDEPAPQAGTDGETFLNGHASILLKPAVLDGLVGFIMSALLSVILWTQYYCQETGPCSRLRACR